MAQVFSQLPTHFFWDSHQLQLVPSAHFSAFQGSVSIASNAAQCITQPRKRCLETRKTSDHYYTYQISDQMKVRSVKHTDQPQPVATLRLVVKKVWKIKISSFSNLSGPKHQRLSGCHHRAFTEPISHKKSNSKSLSVWILKISQVFVSFHL